MAAQLLRFSPLHTSSSPVSAPIGGSVAATSRLIVARKPTFPFPAAATFVSTRNRSISLSLPRASEPTQSLNLGGSGGDGAGGRRGGGSGGGGGGGGAGGSDRDSSGAFEQSDHLGPLGLLINGWRSRVAADPQFPFKVLMEELVGVSACVLGDMASRPNFGLNELDFVFSTLVVGSILNFVLMYLLAPTAASSVVSSSLPGVFAKCPSGHMFEIGAYSVLDRLGTFVYKGVQFAAVGFASGLAGTAISNGLINLRKKMDPEFETPNKPPPTVLNATTWAIHMGVSSNFRYQTLNGLEFLLAKVLPPVLFKANVIALRCLNNVLGGVTFVMLARLTGSQKVEAVTDGKGKIPEEEKLLGGEEISMTENEERVIPGSDSQSVSSSK